MFTNGINSYKVFASKRYTYFFLLYALFFLASGPLEKAVPLVIAYHGFSEATYGIFLSMVSFTFIFAPTVIAYLSIKKFGPYVLGVLGSFIGFLGAIMLSLDLLPAWLVFLFCYMILLARVIFNYSIGNKINTVIESHNRSKYFALRDLFLFGAISVGLLAGGFLTARLSVLHLYFIFSSLFVLTCLFIFVMRAQSILADNNGTLHSVENSDDIKKVSEELTLTSVLKTKVFWAFVLINVFTSIYSISARFLPLLGLQLGFDVSSLLTLVGVATIANAIFGLVLGYFFDMRSRKLIYLIDIFVDLIPALTFAFTGSTVFFVIAYIITILKDVFAPISFSYFFDCFPESNAQFVLGLLSSIDGVTSTIVPILVGFLWLKSHRLVFIAGAAGIVGAFLIAFLVLPNVKKEAS
ncbi:MAG: MFS transporter [Peptococcaceae bacterium]|nr:MFS transporter [Peptococcaceae bacterium]